MTDKSGFDLHTSDQRFQLLVNAVTDYAIYMLDPAGNVVSWNPGAKRFKGYEADEIIGQHFSRFFEEEDRAAGLPEHALRTAAAEGRFEAEGWRVRKDGTRFWVSAVIDAIRDEAGILIGFAKITRDITAKREAEQRLFSSEQRFRLLVQGVTDYAIYMLDPDGRVTNWNSGAAAIKGYSAAEIIGEHFSRFYTEQDRAAGEPARALQIALREGKYEAEAQRVRKDGQTFWAHVVIDLVRDDSGKHIGFAKITRDITEKRETQRQLEETRNALFQSQKLQALGELTGGIAHDFNNLLTVIRGSADLLRREGLSAQKRDQYLAAIVETADHAATLTSHLLAFGRRQALKPEVIDLNVRLDAFAEVLSRTLGGKIEVSLNLAPALGLVEVDSTQLETALLNAAINARDAMPGGGTLTLSTRNIDDAAGKMVCVALSDTGEGMTPEVLNRVFEPFFTTKVIGKGTGLGLSQIHGFAAQAGGRVELTSVPEQGTTVHILLPRTDKPAATAVTLRSGNANGNDRTLLLVEDNAAVREFAHGLLTELGYRVISVECAEAAIERLEAERIDLVFSDVVMPGLSGVELERIVRARFPDIPVLLASGYSEEIALGTAGDLTVLPKPYGAESLAAALADVVGAKNRQPA